MTARTLMLQRVIRFSSLWGPDTPDPVYCKRTKNKEQRTKRIDLPDNVSDDEIKRGRKRPA
jgi:hypothetical protein